MILNQDAILFMENKESFADLIIADPPFNINWQYSYYKDNLEPKEFLEWNKKWITLAQNCLKPNGTMFVCMGDEYISEIDLICKDIGLFRKDWLIWHYSFGQSGPLNNRKKFIRSKTHILRLTKDKNNFTFNAKDIAVPSLRQTKYNDKRASSFGKCPNDVLIYNRIAGTHKDRIKNISTQMPEDLISVLILACSNKGDVIYDPFAGSGISLITAKKLNRSFMGTEINPELVTQIKALL